MIKNGEKTTAYLPLSKDSFGVDKISAQIKDDRFIVIAHSETIPEVKTLINILNDENIDGCILDYSDALGYESQVGGVTCVDDYIRKNGVVIFFSSKGWDPDFDDIIAVKHE